MIQTNLDPPLNSKSVHNYVTELLRKFGNCWGPGFYVMNFCSYLPDLPLLLVLMSFDVYRVVPNFCTDGAATDLRDRRGRYHSY
jgi:hypothetical protein